MEPRLASSGGSLIGSAPNRTGVAHPSDDASGADVASFYHLPRTGVTGKSCQGLACWVARSLDPARWLAAEQPGPRIYCLGNCFAAPARAELTCRPHVQVAAPRAIVLPRLVSGGARRLTTYRELGGYEAWRRARQLAPERILEIMEASGLRGRGGAGFPVGRKWRSAAAQPPGEKFLIANADEGDPGAYIDRFLLEEDPHAIIEGLLIGAHAVGATHGWIYVRSEYPAAQAIVLEALQEARAAGWLGPDALGVGRPFDLAVHPGGGSYVCGEETALIRSLEGRRPEVLARPPYVTESGLWRRPTVVNNVETLVNVPWIVTHGGDAYHALGHGQSRGTKVVSLNSLFRRPGLYEVEFGVSVRHIVEDLGGGLRTDLPIKAVLIGGPLAGLIPPHLFDTRLGFEELRAIGAGVGHGGVVAFDERTSIQALLQHVFSFAAYESCGKCTPCRRGSRLLADHFAARLRQHANGTLSEADVAALIVALKWTSLCGLGTGLAEFAESAFRHFGKELNPCPP